MSRKAIRQKTIRLKTNDRTLDRYAHILKPLGYYPVLGFSSDAKTVEAFRSGQRLPEGREIDGDVLICGFATLKA
jgi:hypothetical protein